MEMPLQKIPAKGNNAIVLLLVALAMACAARLLLTLMVTDSANFEGIYYLRIAENLAAGRGSLALTENGVQLLRPPGFPGLIAWGASLFGNAEVAGHVINIAVGALLVVPVFLIAQLLSGDRVAVLAALLAALHSYLVATSTVILTEPLYVLLLLTATYYVLTSDTSYLAYRAIIAGLCLGLAYLVRPEALLFAIVGAIALIAMHRHELWSALRITSVLVTCFAVVAVPYVGWLSKSTGQFMLESKSSTNYAWKSQLMAGMSGGEMFFAINDDLSPKGISMMSDAERIKKWQRSPTALMVFAVDAASQTLPDLAKRLSTTQVLGNPLLVVFVLISLGSVKCRRQSLSTHAALIILSGGTALALLLAPTQTGQERYLFPCFLPMLIWAADGIHWFAGWLQDLCAAHATRCKIRWIPAAAVSLSVLLLILLPIPALRDVSDFQQAWGDSHTNKEIGRWLKSYAGSERPRVMASGPTAAYYSGGVLISFPYTTSERAIEFIEAQKVDFLILPARLVETRPYARNWIEHGIPDPRATAVYRASDSNDGDIVVYRWMH